jgi:hypothetical protein
VHGGCGTGSAGLHAATPQLAVRCYEALCLWEQLDVDRREEEGEMRVFTLADDSDACLVKYNTQHTVDKFELLFMS